MVDHNIKFPIEVDKKTRKISVGKWVADRIYYNYPRKEQNIDLKKEILKANGIEHLESTVSNSLGYREIHKEIVPLLGSRFNARLKAVTCETWINPIKEILNKYCLCWRVYEKTPYFEPGQLRRTWKVLSYVKQAELDGIDHVVPFIIYFMDTPKALKRDLGKSMWRKIANNTLSFNLCLVRYLCQLEGREADHRVLRMQWSHFDSMKEDLVTLLSLKKTLVRNIGKYYWGVHGYSTSVQALRAKGVKAQMNWVNKYALVSKKSSVEHLLNLYRDTANMAEQQSQPFKLCSPKKMTKQHDRLVERSRMLHRQRLLAKQEAINKKFLWLSPYGEVVHQAFSRSRTVKVELINQYERLLDESDSMEHCVVNYEQYISQGRYIVISLKSKEQRSTLGLYFKNEDVGFGVDQHYGFRNHTVSCRYLVNASKKILEEVNQVFMIKKKAA